jgi:hypothetical protein
MEIERANNIVTRRINDGQKTIVLCRIVGNGIRGAKRSFAK